jgi:hypothetical protein
MESGGFRKYDKKSPNIAPFLFLTARPIPENPVKLPVSDTLKKPLIFTRIARIREESHSPDYHQRPLHQGDFYHVF